MSLGRLPRPAGGGERVPVLGLPGNPVSALVTFLVLGYPAIRSLGGHRRAFLPRIRATVRAPLAGPPHLTRFLRVRLEPEGGGRWGAEPAGAQGSGVLRTFAATDGLAIVSEGTEALAPGNPVEVLLLPHPGWPENR